MRCNFQLLICFIVLSICASPAFAYGTMYTQSLSNGNSSDSFTQYTPNKDIYFNRPDQIIYDEQPYYTSQPPNYGNTYIYESPARTVIRYTNYPSYIPNIHYRPQYPAGTGGMQIHTNPFGYSYNYGGSTYWNNRPSIYSQKPPMSIKPPIVNKPPAFKPNHGYGHGNFGHKPNGGHGGRK